MLARQFQQAKTALLGSNHSTRLYVLVQGILVGLGGMAHGIFDVLQGSVPTGGYLVSFGIFTLIPNYLATGIAAILMGLAVIAWTTAFMHTRRGPLVFLALSILLFLVGGGVFTVLIFVITFAVATQIDRPHTWWKKALPPNLRRRLAKAWPVIFVGEYAVFLTAVAIWLFLSPPSTAARAPTVVEYVLWSFLLVGILLQPLTIVSGFARNIEHE